MVQLQFASLIVRFADSPPSADSRARGARWCMGVR